MGSKQAFRPCTFKPRRVRRLRQRRRTNAVLQVATASTCMKHDTWRRRQPLGAPASQPDKASILPCVGTDADCCEGLQPCGMLGSGFLGVLCCAMLCLQACVHSLVVRPVWRCVCAAGSAVGSTLQGHKQRRRSHHTRPHEPRPNTEPRPNSKPAGTPGLHPANKTARPAATHAAYNIPNLAGIPDVSVANIASAAGRCRSTCPDEVRSGGPPDLASPPGDACLLGYSARWHLCGGGCKSECCIVPVAVLHVNYRPACGT